MNKNNFLLLLVLLLSCNDEPVTFEIINYEDQGKVISLLLPEFALPKSSCLKAARFNDQDLLYYYNSAKRQILMYDIATEELIHTIQLYRQGPNEVNGFKGFTILDRDRIMISTFPQKLLTVNLDGLIVDQIDYNMTSEAGQFSRPITLNSHDKNDIYRTDDGYIIPQEPPYRQSGGEATGLEGQAGSSVFIEINDGAKKFSKVKLPSEILTGLHENSILFLTSAFVDGTLYWAHRTDMDIYYTTDFEHVEKKEIENPVPRDSRDPQSLGLYGYEARMRIYQSLIYDPYREKFYRMVRYGVENPDEMYGQDEIFVARYPVKFSIFVYDKLMNPENEVFFQGTNYNFIQYFIASDGFYLSLNNPENPDFDEDFLRFERIEL